MSNQIMTKQHVKQRYYIEGTMTNSTRLLIGQGENETTDLCSAVDEEGRAIVPATSLMGYLLRQFSKDFESNPNYQKSLNYFLGQGDDTQSHLRADNMVLKGTNRKKVYYQTAINQATNQAEDKSLRAQEVVDPKQVFSFGFLVSVRKDFDVCHFEIFIRHLLDILQDGIAVGANQKLGFGRMRMTFSEIYKYDLTQFPDQERYLHFLEHRSHCEEAKWSPYDSTKITVKKENILSIRFEGILRQNIIIGDYQRAGKADKYTVTLADNGLFVPGSSLRGPLVHRMNRIKNSFSHLFPGLDSSLIGYVFEQENEAVKSRLVVMDYYLIKSLDCPEEQQQTRNQIDRLTSSTLGHALFQSRPMVEERKLVHHLEIRDPRADDLKLVMAALKDLFHGDLAIGGEKNIGRGRVKGNQIQIKWKETELVINEGGGDVEKWKSLIKDLENEENIREFAQISGAERA